MKSLFLEQLRKKKKLNEDDIITIHELMMSEYGWIPLEEFRKIPIPTLLNLLTKMDERYEKQKGKMPKRGLR